MTARDAGSAESLIALEKLCRAYWYPLYVFIRRRGYGPHEAQDLTQEFFARLIEKGFLCSVDRMKGKFRTFLLAALENFLAKEWNRAHRLKRGGHAMPVSLDAQEAENRYGLEPPDLLTPEKIFERRWALTVLNQAMDRLREECEAKSKGALFRELKGALSGDRQAKYTDIGTRLSMSEGAVKVAVHRLRERYAELLREEIGNTVSHPDEVEDEIRHLFAALA
jgi:RNA polymerase sigma-70 factor (ECF subfamily)